uniref:C3H1-type domain-containing protein n=1 Tax=Zea mays TaxID=4577 RepID=A0A804PQT5_MAIZE
MWLLAMVLSSPCLVLIDHGHFQCNCISLGLTLGAIAGVLSRNKLVTATLFTLAIIHKQELELLSDGANVYKLIGPVLVKQDLVEAKANVKKRIEYISAELKRMDRALKDLEEKQNNKKESLLHICNSPFVAADQLGYDDGADTFYADEYGCWSPAGAAGAHRRSFSLSNAEATASWRPYMYYARGYCKNGSSCRFFHGVPEDDAAEREMAGT